MSGDAFPESLTVDPCEECGSAPGDADGIVEDHTTFVWKCPEGHENRLDVTARYEED